jgi:hypothetical protein
LYIQREEQIRKEMERHDRERRKEEERLLREKQREVERHQREQRRELERREKFLQKESIRVGSDTLFKTVLLYLASEDKWGTFFFLFIYVLRLRK